MIKQKTKSWEQAFDTACADGLIKTYPKFEIDIIGIKQFIKSLLHQERKRVMKELREDAQDHIVTSENREMGEFWENVDVWLKLLEEDLSILKKRSKV